MTHNHNLRIAIVHTGVKQYRIADLAKINESRFSKIVNGRIEATPEEQKRIARALKKPVSELFGVTA